MPGMTSVSVAYKYSVARQSVAGRVSVSDIYKGVIHDVINQVKEAFLDENVDVDILQQLKKEWEDKVTSSGCVEMESRNALHNIAPPPMRGQHVMPQRMGNVAQVRLQSNNPQLVSNQPHHTMHMDTQGQRPISMQYVQQPTMQQIQVQQNPMASGASFQPQIASGVRMVQSIQPGQQYVITQGAGQQLSQGVMFIHNSNVQHIPVTLPPTAVFQQRVNIQIEQKITRDSACSSSTPGNPREKKKKVSREEAEKIAIGLLRVLQLDGGGGGMSDSSSDEEEPDDDDDPLRRIADRIGDGQVDDGEQAIVEEDPLNSEDDQSDDEDLETLFDAENVIMCQFEKVHRARSKWKFQLKDGIMHIDNRDYCFQKCSGEAEW
uniref:Transcription initiation factor IIA subunit 1 n=1 Tax=Heterorhabditis bacteriophora TaxID=37862 RepID=A0A1I7XFI7_HETBA